MIITNPIGYASKNQNCNVGLLPAATIHLTLPAHLVYRTIAAASRALACLIASPFISEGLKRCWEHCRDAGFNGVVALFALFAPFTAVGLLSEGIQAKETSLQENSNREKLEKEVLELTKKSIVNTTTLLWETLSLLTNLSEDQDNSFNVIGNYQVQNLEDLTVFSQALSKLVDDFRKNFPQTINASSDEKGQEPTPTSRLSQVKETSETRGSPVTNPGGKELNFYTP